MAEVSERQHYLNICSFRELFGGRFDEEEAAFILAHFNEEFQEAVNFVLSSESIEVRRVIDVERGSWTPARRQRAIATIDNLQQQPQSLIMDRARSGRIDTTYRMFACRPCDNFWWRRVPDRKIVSKCERCRQRYDPLPREEEWGWAEFLCTYCGHQFAGWCGMWYSSPCYKCLFSVFPTRILPPLRKNQRQRRDPRNQHRCGAPDCTGHLPTHQPPMVRGENGQELPITCVYPPTRRSRQLPIVIVPSDPHDSTGSTVNTFLPQNDLTSAFEIVPLMAIDENDDNDVE